MALYVYLGSGGDWIQGFTHLDNNIRKEPWGRKIEILADLRDPLPFRSEEVDLYYSIHTLEHLTYPDLITCLSECYRSLAIGGMIRVVVPDMDIMIHDYINNSEFLPAQWEVRDDYPLENSSQFFV
jgi:predicted SAM-dependent methyltransferase